MNELEAEGAMELPNPEFDTEMDQDLPSNPEAAENVDTGQFDTTESNEAEVGEIEAGEMTAPSLKGHELGNNDPAGLEDPKSNELSTEYVGRWSQLVSTTNWEKGRIILEWREALEGSEAPAASYSDEAWSRRVGGVTPQHVGRLRRVYERFGTTYQTYEGVYWSHFLAALDWDDAEMWLEGALQSKWSVSEMRQMRWEASGHIGTPPPVIEHLATADDEDYTPLTEVDDATGKDDGPRTTAEGPRYDDPDFGDEDQPSGAIDSSADEDDLPWDEPSSTPTVSPFAQLASLPVDIAEALEQFKLAIIRHRADGWGEVPQADVVKAIDALRAFAVM